MDSSFHRYPYRPTTSGNRALARKVVNIPVTFVGVNRARSDSDSALRIQRAFRGHLVRKTFRKIAAIRAEVLEVESAVREEGQSVELLRKEEKERVKVNERLMSLLLRLDTVSGVDHGIRELRRAVIRKAIALQDAVDAIAVTNADVEDGVHHDSDHEETTESNQDNSSAEPEQIGDAVLENTTPDPENNADVEGADRCLNHEKTAEEEEKADGCNGDVAVEITSPPCPDNKTDAELEDQDCNHEKEADGCGVDDVAAVESSGEDLSADPEEEGGEVEAEEREEEEVVERMREDNKRMMGMMAELLERNEEQMRLLTSLSHRVEMLERAFLWDRLRRKINKNCKQAKRNSVECDLPLEDLKKSDER